MTNVVEDRWPLVYIAGPYTHPDPITNTRSAIEAAELVLGSEMVPIVPHLTMLWHLVIPKPIDEWYAYDLDVMRRCDVVWRLPGASTGADREVSVAIEEGMPVVHSFSELSAWFEERHR